MAAKNRLAGAAVLAVAGVLFALPGRTDDHERAKALFALCASCHGEDAGGNRLFFAPAIAGMSEWYVASQLRKFRSGLRGTHFDDLMGMRMRPMALTLASDEDVDIVAKYVASLPPTDPAPVLEGGDPVRGQALFAVCVQCHGPTAEGKQEFKSGPLARTNDWYLFEQLKKFRAGVRGSPVDPEAILMRPMALSLPDEQALKDVLAYISTLSRGGAAE